MILYTTSLEVSRHTSRAVFDLCRIPYTHVQVVVTQTPSALTAFQSECFIVASVRQPAGFVSSDRDVELV